MNPSSLGPEVALDPVHVALVADGRQDRSVGAGTPDAVFLELLHQRGLREARRGLREVLLRLEAVQREALPLLQLRELLAGLVAVAVPVVLFGAVERP